MLCEMLRHDQLQSINWEEVQNLHPLLGVALIGMPDGEPTLELLRSAHPTWFLPERTEKPTVKAVKAFGRLRSYVEHLERDDLDDETRDGRPPVFQSFDEAMEHLFPRAGDEYTSDYDPDFFAEIVALIRGKSPEAGIRLETTEGAFILGNVFYGGNNDYEAPDPDEVLDGERIARVYLYPADLVE